MREQALMNAIKDLVTLRGGVPVRVNSGSIIFKKDGVTNVVKGAEKGTSDLLCCFRGRFLAIEVKVGKNRLSQEQEDFGQWVREAGGIFLTAYNLDEVNNLLDCLEER